jgi:hypothetical protein
MYFKEEADPLLNIAGTIHTSVDLTEICETETRDADTDKVPCVLRIDWRTLIAKWLVEDIFYNLT